MLALQIGVEFEGQRGQYSSSSTSETAAQAGATGWLMARIRQHNNARARRVPLDIGRLLEEVIRSHTRDKESRPRESLFIAYANEFWLEHTKQLLAAEVHENCAKMFRKLVMEPLPHIVKPRLDINDETALAWALEFDHRDLFWTILIHMGPAKVLPKTAELRQRMHLEGQRPDGQVQNIVWLGLSGHYWGRVQMSTIALGLVHVSIVTRIVPGLVLLKSTLRKVN